MYHAYGPFGWGIDIGWFVVIFLLIVVWFVVKSIKQTKTLKHGTKSPLDILKERYAKGEIDKEEYEERKETLKNS